MAKKPTKGKKTKKSTKRHELRRVDGLGYFAITRSLEYPSPCATVSYAGSTLSIPSTGVGHATSHEHQIVSIVRGAAAPPPRPRARRTHPVWCFRHQLLLPRPYLVLTKPLRLDIQCQRGASVKIGWKYLDD